MSHTGIAVIEGTWWRKSNVSVRELFGLIANIHCENPNAYHYEMANCEAAIKEAIPRVASYRECRWLYLAMHGDAKGLSFVNDEQLTRTELRNVLRSIKQTDGATLRGLHLGACLFGTEKLAKFLFADDVCSKWIVGYSTEVNWIESSALDLLFFNELLSRDEDTENQRITAVAERLLEIAPGLISNLGFGIFTRKSGGGIKNLLSAAYG